MHKSTLSSFLYWNEIYGCEQLSSVFTHFNIILSAFKCINIDWLLDKNNFIDKQTKIDYYVHRLETVQKNVNY